MKADQALRASIDAAAVTVGWSLGGWRAVYLREMLLFRRKALRPGYVLSAMVVPLLYLVVFGFGLGRSVKVGGAPYLEFLLPGLVAMSAMNNSYSWAATTLNLHRLYFKTFQTLMQAPITPADIVVGEVLAASSKGLFAASLLVVPGVLMGALRVTPLFVAAVLLTCLAFAALGVIVGMLAKTHEDTATYNNFFIMPMAFLGGTFFPVNAVPPAFRFLFHLIPLTHATRLLRSPRLEGGAIASAALLALFAAGLFLAGVRMVARYDE